eukprot:6187842-Pleurochrysis_carterae.AAC.1
MLQPHVDAAMGSLALRVSYINKRPGRRPLILVADSWPMIGIQEFSLELELACPPNPHLRRDADQATVLRVCVRTTANPIFNSSGARHPSTNPIEMRMQLGPSSPVRRFFAIPTYSPLSLPLLSLTCYLSPPFIFWSYLSLPNSLPIPRPRPLHRPLVL